MGSTHAGRYNRIAGNDFHENSITAENYISKDLVNITIPQIENEVRLLVPAQRKQLHQLILAVANAGNEENYQVWQRVHAEIGVKSVEEMTINQYQPACNYLCSQISLYQELSRKNELISSLLKASASNNSYKDLIKYCRKKFGSSRLKSL